MSDARQREGEPPPTRCGGETRYPAAVEEPGRRNRTKSCSGAPRPMKMGTMRSPWRYGQMRLTVRAQPKVRQNSRACCTLSTSPEAPCGLGIRARQDSRPTLAFWLVTRYTVTRYSWRSPMVAAAERMKMMRQRRRARGLRELRLVVADPRSRAVRRRVAKQVAGLDLDRERDALKWIESVSEFDADATR